MDAGDDTLGRAPRHEPIGGFRPGDEPGWVADGTPAIRASLCIEQLATAPNITAARRRFAEWLALDVPAGDELDDLVLAVYELLANVVDHAYDDGPGPLRLTADREPEAVRVTVADEGRWRTTSPTPFRRHGLGVIRMLVAQVHIDATPAGTVVHLRSAVPRPS